MGLREKQQVRRYQEEVLPEIRARLREITGGDIAIAVDWSTFENSAEALDQLEHQGLGRIVDAVRGTCYNDFGKQVVREGLKTITVVDVPTVADKRVTFADGVLAVFGAYGTGNSEGMPQDTVIQHTLEDGL